MNKLKIFLPITCLVIATTLLIVIYCYHFLGTPLSDNTSDWGAWGSYANIGISLISIYLIYVTYKEQSKSNKISRFEEQYKTSVQTLNELLEKESSLIYGAYGNLCEHFRGALTNEPEGSKEQNCHILRFYYSSILFEDMEHLDDGFRYLDLVLSNLCKSMEISEEEKQGRILELSCILSEDVRILFFCWKILREDEYLLAYCFRNGFFKIDSDEDCLLANIIRYICTGEIKKDKKVLGNYDDIDLGDTYKKGEDYFDTFDKLFNKKSESYDNN